ncbi:MAG TPA: hypothetical protein VFU22_02820 [Roseiflexaceae bacterium]|nr:hypothetical protein [Roseiflexaceae bacterium]
MSQPVLANIPLLGALCVAAGLVTEAQLEACLQLQKTAYHGTPIGQILVLHSYLSQPDLARMVAQQQSFRRTVCRAIEQTDTLVNNETATSAQPNFPKSDHPRASAMPELERFAEAEIDASPLFDARR